MLDWAPSDVRASKRHYLLRGRFMRRPNSHEARSHLKRGPTRHIIVPVYCQTIKLVGLFQTIRLVGS